METEQIEQVTERTPQEKHADGMCEALENISPADDNVMQVVWKYFRDGQDHLAFMLMQTSSLDSLVGYVEEIQMSIDRLTDENGALSVNTWEQNT